MEGLKPCPFCGGLAVAGGWPLEGVYCYSCGAEGPKDPSLAIAIEKWNRRTYRGE